MEKWGELFEVFEVKKKKEKNKNKLKSIQDQFE